MVLRIEKIPYGQMAPCPGKKAFASPKKAVIPFFPMRASAVSAQLSLSPRVSLRENEEGRTGKVSPGPFRLRRLLSCPGNKETGLNDQLELEIDSNMFTFFAS